MEERFSERDVDQLATYLLEHNIPEETCELFKDNYIDGESFLDLTEGDIKSLVNKLGVVKKLLRLQATILHKRGSSPTLPLRASTSEVFQSCAQSSSVPPFASPPYAQSSSVSPFSSPPYRHETDSDDAVSVGSSSSTVRPDFNIPDIWRPSIMASVNARSEEDKKLGLTAAVRNEIVRDLVTQMYAYNAKPDRAFCTKVAKLLIKKYSYMKDVGTNVSGYGSWEKKIVERVHNVRSSCARKRLSSQTEFTTSAKRGRPKSSSTVCRYPPLATTENDEISDDRHHQMLSREMEREKPRKENVLSLMRQTYYTRREYILKESDDVSVSSILEKYKGLTLPYAIEQEMDLILAKKDVALSATTEWKSKWTPALLQLSETLTGKQGALLKQSQRICHGREESDEKLAFLQLCNLFHKKGSDTLSYVYEECQVTDDPDEVATGSPRRDAPRIASFPDGDKHSYFIFVEGKTLFSVSSFTKALVIWFMIHYVFNLEYCKQSREISLFVQEFVFGLPESSKGKSSRYLTICSDVSKFT